MVGAHILAGASTYLVFTNLYSQTVALLSIAVLVSRLTSAGMGKLSSIRKLTIAFIAYEVSNNLSQCHMHSLVLNSAL